MTGTILERADPQTPALAVRELLTREPVGDPAAPNTLEGVSFEVPQRAVTALLGLPGSGKSALLRTIAGLDKPRRGQIEVGGRTVTGLPPHRRGLGLVSQDPGLFRRLSVVENIRFGLRIARWRSSERELRVAELLRVFGLADRRDARIGALTPAERLWVAIARAVALQPRVLLLDEPLAGIPAIERPQERITLRQLLRRLQLAVLVATSDVEDALALASNLAILSAGRLIQHGAVRQVASRPSTLEAARLLGYVLLIDGRVEGARINELGVGAVPTPAGGAHAGRVLVLAHAASLLAVPVGRGLGVGVTGEVAASRPLGPLWQVEVSLGGRAPVLARWEWDDQPPSPGAAVELVTPVGGLVVFARPGLAATIVAPRRAPDAATEAPTRLLAETG